MAREGRAEAGLLLVTSSNDTPREAGFGCCGREAAIVGSRRLRPCRHDHRRAAARPTARADKGPRIRSSSSSSPNNANENRLALSSKPAPLRWTAAGITRHLQVRADGLAAPAHIPRCGSWPRLLARRPCAPRRRPGHVYPCMRRERRPSPAAAHHSNVSLALPPARGAGRRTRCNSRPARPQHLTTARRTGPPVPPSLCRHVRRLPARCLCSPRHHLHAPALQHSSGPNREKPHREQGPWEAGPRRRGAMRSPTWSTR